MDENVILASSANIWMFILSFIRLRIYSKILARVTNALMRLSLPVLTFDFIVNR